MLMATPNDTYDSGASTPALSGAARADVDVCICTFRRVHVAETIASVARQTAAATQRIRIIVADNDETPSARETVEQAFRDARVNGLYLHAPSRNISIARNACLDAVTAPFATFIDDDETAHPDWLDRLLARQAEAGADIVFGEVAAVYPDSAPDWVKRADLHSTRAVRRNGRVETGYTGNVLIRMGALNGARFDLDHGLTGGEDTLFFAALNQRGVKLDYCAQARIDEPVSPDRASLRWLARRAYRFGQTHMLRKRQSGGALTVVPLAALKAATCFGAAVLTIWSPVKWRQWVVRGALHAGVVGGAMGRRTLQLYGEKRG